MKQVIDNCKQCDCDQQRLIVNKRYYLCQEKNHERIHGESIAETSKRKAAAYNESSRKRAKQRSADSNSTFKAKGATLLGVGKQSPNRSKRPKQRSERQSFIERRYAETCRIIDAEREPKCSGCGRYQSGDIRLSHSHIISRREAQNAGRIELIYDKENIALHCMDFGEHQGCHAKWENPKRRHELLDYEANKEFVRNKDERIFRRMFKEEP